jgi:DNA-binding NarL/FixJ family response regulator
MAVVVAIAGCGDVVANGLRHILGQAPDLEVMDTYPDWGGVVPDAVLYDLMGLARDDGAELHALIDAHESAVVVVTRDLRPDLAARAMARGAAAWVSLEAPAAQVLAMVRTAAQVGLVSTESFAGCRALGTDANLTPREVTVLSGIVKGLSNRAIAEMYGLSPNTIKSVIRSAYRRIGVSTRSQAVSWGINDGFEPANQLAPNLPPCRRDPGHFRSTA